MALAFLAEFWVLLVWVRLLWAALVVYRIGALHPRHQNPYVVVGRVAKKRERHSQSRVDIELDGISHWT